MKKLLAGLAALALSAAAASALALLPPGPAAVRFYALTQGSPYHLVSSKTNETANATNITLMASASTTSTPFVSSNLLALLANSFNTNFPAGSQIGMSSGNLLVLDASGTNVIFNPSNVLTTTFNEGVTSEKVVQISTLSQGGTSTSGNSSAVITSDVTIRYDDTGVSPADGTNSVFQLRGVLVQKVISNLKTSFDKVTYEFQGSGGGTIDGVQTILSGTIKANATGSGPPI